MSKFVNRNPKICAYCGEKFIPESSRQKYCKSPHFGPCPVCGEAVEIKEMYTGPQACSEKCRQQRIASTCESKYGNRCVLNSQHGRATAVKNCMERYGRPNASGSPEVVAKREATMEKRYGVKYAQQSPEIQEKTRQTSLQVYGCEHPAQNPQVKQKAADTWMRKWGGIAMASPAFRASVESTCERKYGTRYYMCTQQFRDQAQIGLLVRYGVITAMQCTEVQSQARTTYFQNTGFYYPWQNPSMIPSIQSKIKYTMMSKYGVDNAAKCPELVEKAKATMVQRYGVPWYVMSEACSHKNPGKISKLNKHMLGLFREVFPDAVPEKHIRLHSFDIFIPSLGVVIEINPTVTHNSHQDIYNEQSHGYSPLYHSKKTKVAASAGFRCIHMFDWTTFESAVDACYNPSAQSTGIQLHWYNDRTNSHITDSDLSYDELIARGYLPVYDDGQLLRDVPGITLHDIRSKLY